MKILAIETSTLTGSIALISDEKLLGETTLSVSVRHSERLMPAIEQLLRDADTRPKDVDLYAVAEGPGSFTGLRIGIAAAQGLAMACGKPLAGLSTLRGLAMNAAFHTGIVVPVLNAFRGEIYYGVYRLENGLPVPLQEDGVISVDGFVEMVGAWTETAVLIGNGIELCQPQIPFAANGKIIISSEPLNTPRASNLAFLAGRLGSSVPSMPVLPRYLRKPG